jgi:hypothetical protein
MTSLLLVAYIFGRVETQKATTCKRGWGPLNQDCVDDYEIQNAHTYPHYQQRGARVPTSEGDRRHIGRSAGPQHHHSSVRGHLSNVPTGGNENTERGCHWITPHPASK